ncbi:MAG: RNA polymerase sigma factor [Planctomycetes bacterium]|nr:RNA polymerase sigma factor [Planctomycetota bacterium]
MEVMTIVSAAHERSKDYRTRNEAAEPDRTAALERSTIEAIQRGDHAAFRDLVRDHGRWVRGVIFGVLGNSDRVDDVCQQVFTALWTRIGELRDVERWRPWVYRLARNAAVDAGRSVARQRALQSKLAEQPLVDQTANPPVKSLVDREVHETVLAAIGGLPELYREPFVLRHLEGWSYARIGETMNLPVDTVETRLVRARRLLRETLKGRL